MGNMDTQLNVSFVRIYSLLVIYRQGRLCGDQRLLNMSRAIKFVKQSLAIISGHSSMFCLSKMQARLLLISPPFGSIAYPGEYKPW